MESNNKTMKLNNIFWIGLLFIIGICITLHGCKKKSESNSSTDLTDIDGNIYHTVTIGTQVWMVENLKTTRYRNGDTIPNVSSSNQWITQTSGAYCNYNNDPTLADTCGKLYNWYAVNDSRNIAPVGFHIPSYDEWQLLLDYLNGDSIAGGKLKEKGTNHWNSPNTGATNETGFTALPAGYRSIEGGIFAGLGNGCSGWTSTPYEYGLTRAWYYVMTNIYKSVGNFDGHKGSGYSVRCIKDK